MPSEFAVSRTVEVAETDMAGLMHFSNYFRWMEACEAAFYRSLGLPMAMFCDPARQAWPRVKVECEYQAPLRFNDTAEVKLFVKRVGGKSVTYVFTFRTEGRLTARGEMTVVCVAADPAAPGGMTSTSLPAEFRAKLQVANESAYAAG
ncbi:MAG TPA: thioesterase family protein [Candidatus Didemnitutus sp.]|nr:thioesterase family protein [Candidatus Didemnitutus sp.]